MDPFELASLQIANRFFYNSAISRVQTNIKKTIIDTFETQFFTTYWDGIIKDKIVAYGQNKEIKHIDFNVSDGSTNNVNWYSRQFAETEIFQLSIYGNTTRILSLENGTFICRKMASRNLSNLFPSLCLVQKVFVWVIGGSTTNDPTGDKFKAVECYDLQENRWDRKPQLNTGRESAASCEHDGHVFVFCGILKDFERTNTIERISLKGCAAFWEQFLVNKNDLKPRSSPVVVSLNDNQIAILGGSHRDGENRNDVVLFDTANGLFQTEIRKNLHGLKFEC